MDQKQRRERITTLSNVDEYVKLEDLLVRFNEINAIYPDDLWSLRQILVNIAMTPACKKESVVLDGAYYYIPELVMFFCRKYKNLVPFTTVLNWFEEAPLYSDNEFGLYYSPQESKEVPKS